MTEPSHQVALAGERWIAGEPAELFDLLIDPKGQLAWNSLYLEAGMTEAGPIRDGSVMTGRFKGAGRASVTFADVVPGKEFAHLSTLAAVRIVRLGSFRHHYGVEPSGEGTLVRQTVTIDLTWVGRLLRSAITSAMAKRLPESFDELAAYATRSPHQGD